MFSLGSHTFHAARRDYISKKRHRRDRQDNQSRAFKNTHTHVRASERAEGRVRRCNVCWLCLFAGVINQCGAVRASNMSRREKWSSGPVCCMLGYTLQFCTGTRPSDRAQIMLMILRVCVSVCVLVAGHCGRQQPN